MVRESYRFWRGRPPKSVSILRRPLKTVAHNLPFRLRFPRSGLYISVLPPLALGFAIGALSAIMGIGGGFILIPAMIYLLRMPTNVVIGTSLFQVLVITSLIVVLQSAATQTVDLVLALLLMLGGVVGAQIGARVGAGMKAEYVRGILGALADRGERQVPVRSRDPAGRDLRARRRHVVKRAARRPRLCAARRRTAPRAQQPADDVANDLPAGVAEEQITVSSTYGGSYITVFGVNPDRRGRGDIVVVLRGPNEHATVMRKRRVLGLWINGDPVRFSEAPCVLRRAEQSPAATEIASPQSIWRYQLDPAASAQLASAVPAGGDPSAYRAALVRLRREQGLYQWYIAPAARRRARRVDGVSGRPLPRCRASARERADRAVSRRHLPLPRWPADFGAAHSDHDFAHRCRAHDPRSRHQHLVALRHRHRAARAAGRMGRGVGIPPLVSAEPPFLPRAALRLGFLGLAPLAIAALISLSAARQHGALGRDCVFALRGGAALVSRRRALRLRDHARAAGAEWAAAAVQRAARVGGLGAGGLVVYVTPVLGAAAIFAGLFAAQAVWDYRSARDAGAPAWYPMLRQVLTGGAMIICMLIPLRDGAAAVLVAAAGRSFGAGRTRSFRARARLRLREDVGEGVVADIEAAGEGAERGHDHARAVGGEAAAAHAAAAARRLSRTDASGRRFRRALRLRSDGAAARASRRAAHRGMRRRAFPARGHRDCLRPRPNRSATSAGAAIRDRARPCAWGRRCRGSCRRARR